MTIDLQNVRFAYPETPSKDILNIDHWTVSEGEHVFLHGPSGSGKSTLLNLLSGITQSQHGDVSVLGQSLNRLKPHERDRFRAHNIGYVFQQFNLISYLSALDNVHLSGHFSKQSRNKSFDSEAKALLEKLNIAIDDWNKPAAKLSIGQQQRVAIARALVHKPKILIADEPSSALDEHNRNKFMELLMSVVASYGVTLVFVSHDQSLSHYFSRVDALPDINTLKGRC